MHEWWLPLPYTVSGQSLTRVSELAFLPAQSTCVKRSQIAADCDRVRTLTRWHAPFTMALLH